MISRSDKERVVITGMGAVTPLGNDVETFWENAVAGKSGISFITKCDPISRGFRVYATGEIRNFNPEDFMDKKMVRRNDDFVYYAVAAAKEAIEQAKLEESDLPKDRIGVIVGSGIGGIRGFEENMISLLERNVVSPFLIPRVITDMAAGLISIKYGYQGPNFSIATACATSNHAILNAYHSIRRDEADVIITGGTEGTVTILTIGGFSSAQALSTNENPAEASRPWDKNRDGFVLGEGAGILVVESLQSAKKRGVPILAEIVGGGMSADAYHITAPHPEGVGAVMSMNMALKTSDIKPTDVQYINAHGTSTPLGDLAETKTMKKVFGDYAYKLKINSTKSLSGHLLGAAGGIEAVAVIKTLMTGVIHPTINLKDPDPECDLDYVPNKAIKADVRYAMSNSFGFGGHNCTLTFRRYED